MECVICKTKGWTSSLSEYPAPLISVGYIGVGLALADSEYFRATGRADALGRRLAVLHGDAFGILYFLLGLALHAVCLHQMTSPFHIYYER